MAACSWYGPGRSRRSVAVISVTPSAMAAASQRVRSCSAIGISSPPGPARAGRRASVSSISASSPAVSVSSGRSRCSSRVSRIASAHRSARSSPGPVVAAYPSVKIRYRTCRTAASPVRSLPGRRDGERHAAVGDGLLGPGDPPGHGGLRDQERAGDLGRGQPADRAQRERDLRGRRQRRVAAQEQQDQRVVALGGRTVGCRRLPLTGRDQPRLGVLAPPAGLLGAQHVGQPPGGDGDQPGPRVGRDALVRPLAGRGQQRFLDRVLGRVEVPVAAYHGPEDLRRQPAQQVLGCRLGHQRQGSSSSRDSASGRRST